MDIEDKLQERRILTLGDNINRHQADSLREKLMQLELESDKKIFLLIDSNGGDAAPGFAIYDLITCLRAPVIGIVVGRCSSMAVTILQACEKRIALKHASFFLHCISVTFSFSYHLSDEEIGVLFERRRFEGRESQMKSEEVLASRAGRSVEDIWKLMRDGDVLDARIGSDEAKANGLIDEITENPKEFWGEN